MADPFRFIQSILSTKKNEMVSDADEKEYTPAFTNLGLSQHLDCVPYVNEINMNWQSLTSKMQYFYYLHSIRKAYRKYGKWAKRTKKDDLELIQNYYQINKQKAAEFLLILNDEQIEMIRSTYD